MGKSHLIETEKFYLFDIGVAHYLAGRVPVPHTFEFGKAFEHYIFMALKAYQAYRYPELMLYYWRTSTNREVDFILGDMEAAIEIKTSKRVHETDCKNLQILAEENTVKKKYWFHYIECLPWQIFLGKLWGGEIV